MMKTWWLSQSWRPEVSKKVFAGPCSLPRLPGASFLPLPTSGGSGVLGLWPHPSNPAPSSLGFFPCACVCFSSSLISRTCPWIEGHPNPGSHFEVCNHTCNDTFSKRDHMHRVQMDISFEATIPATPAVMSEAPTIPPWGCEWLGLTGEGLGRHVDLGLSASGWS